MTHNKTLLEMEFIKKIMKLPYVEKIILYGSRARGDYKFKSDIDIAIVCPKASVKNWLQILEIIEKADTLLNIDCVRYDDLGINNPLKKAIDNEGIILFRK